MFFSSEAPHLETTARKVRDLVVKSPAAALRCTDRQERRAAALRTPFPGKDRFALIPSRDNPSWMPADTLLIEISCTPIPFFPPREHQSGPTASHPHHLHTAHSCSLSVGGELCRQHGLGTGLQARAVERCYKIPHGFSYSFEDLYHSSQPA